MYSSFTSLATRPAPPSQKGMGTRLSDKAYDQIRHEIVTLQLAPLSAIDEQALMQKLGLGRTPIREALQRLAAENLVLLAPRRGMFVADVSIQDLQKIFEPRLCLEGLAARLAAERASPVQREVMGEIVQRIGALNHVDGGAMIAIDKAFHEMLYEMADNELLAETLRRLYTLSVRLWQLVLDRLGDLSSELTIHGLIAEAIEARDADRAEALLQQHIRRFQQRIKANL